MVSRGINFGETASRSAESGRLGKRTLPTFNCELIGETMLSFPVCKRNLVSLLLEPDARDNSLPPADRGGEVKSFTPDRVEVVP
jgi:hypothetical protein